MNSKIIIKYIQKVVFVIILLNAYKLEAQSLSESRTNSVYTYVYQLENSELKELLSNYYYSIPDDYYKNKIDSFYNDSGNYYIQKLPIGHYLFVKAEGKQLTTRLISNNTIDVKILDHKTELSLFVHKKGSNEALIGAKVFVKNKSIPFNEKTNTYRLLNANKEGLLVVEYEGEIVFYELDRELNNFKLRRIGNKIFYSFPLKYLHYPFRKLYHSIRNGSLFYRNDYSSKSKGYIAFNKPKYLTNDTLQWKAFITNKNGRPLNKTLVVTLQKEYPQQIIKTDVIHPITKGAYNGTIVLGDSLQLNSRYNLILTNLKSKKRLLINNFYLEDYQLDESTYKIRTEKEHYNFKEPIAIYLKGEDVNGFNILDGRVEINVKTENIIDFNTDRVFVPKKIWNNQVFLDPIGETKIIIPDSVLPEANIKVKIEATFNNSNNETHKEQVYFYYTGAKKWFDSSLNEDSLAIKFYNNYNSINETGWLIGKSIHDTIVQKKVNYPYTEKINPFVHNYYFVSNETTDIMNVSEEKDLFTCNAYKINDSVIISFINPRKIPIHYTIFKNGNFVVDEGEKIDLNKIIIDKSDKSYFISCNYIWGGQEINKEFEVHSYNKNLNVEVNQPYNVFPGQKVDVTVKVKDYKEQPVKNVNLTVGATNGLFKEDNLPKIPYFGKRRKYRPYINSFSISKKSYDSNRLITSDWIQSMDLMKFPFYQFIFPFNTINYSYEPLLELNNAQFAPFIFSSARQVIINMIYIDNKLVFYNETDKNDPYSFIVEEGYHTIRIRTPRREYEIDSVLFKNNFKLNLSFDADSLSPKVKMIEKLSEINGLELENLNQHLLYLKNNFGSNKNVSITQGNKSYSFKTYYSDNNIITTGPYIRDSIYVEVENRYKTSFMFEPGYYYTLSSNKIKIEKKEPLKPIVLSHHSYRVDKSFYEIISPIKEELKTYVWDKPLEKNYSTYTQIGNGTLQNKYEGDSTFCLVKLTRLDSINSSRFYKPYNKYIYDLIPGTYQLLFITCNNTHLLVDSINIKPDGINFVKVDENIHSINDSTLFIESMKLSNTYPGQKFLLPNGGGALKGKIIDKSNEEPLPFANLILFKDDIQIAGTMSDMDGKYTFSNLSRGDYTLTASYVGYQPTKMIGVRVNNGKITFCDVKLGQGVELQSFEIIDYEMPLISYDRTSAGGVVYIDGIRVRGSANLPHSAIAYEDIAKMPSRSASSIASTIGGVTINNELSVNDLNIQKDSKDEGEIPQAGSNSIRNNFKDYAFWKPNLTTNEDGEASFQVVFPDNVTKWKSFAIAMDNKKHSGIGYSETKSYKDLIAQLSNPRFLVVGDKSNLIGKVANYTGYPENISASFLINDSLISSIDSIIENSIIQYLKITTPQSDSIKIQYQIQKTNGYLDGEERSIPIFPIGVEETTGTFNVLTKDTTINFFFKDSSETTIFAESNALEPMLKEIEDLEKYPYYCMEQTASKLIGYLMKKSIYKKMELNFNDERQIKKLIDRLEKGQNEDGSWGWWPNSKSNVFMTTYVLKALLIAKNNSYNIRFTSRATDYLLWNIDVLEDNDLLDAIYILSEFKIEIPYLNYQRKIRKDSLSLYQELITLRIKQNQHIKYSLESILAKAKKTFLGNSFWGNDYFGLYDNSNNLTLLAYQVIEKHDSLNPLLSKIRNYFLEIKGQNKWSNTVDKAQILNTILPGFLNEYDNINQPTSVMFSGSINKNVVNFPYQTTLTGENNLTIQKNGGTPVYLSTYQNKWNTSPNVIDSLFTVTSWFEKDGVPIDSLKSGDPVELKVSIHSKRKGEYIMIDIPIPAGCSYGNNKYNTNYIEIHREYYKNKTTIFCEQINTGDYTFSISLQPRFNGIYTLNPAKIELMYFPLFYGRNEIKKVIIE